MVLGHLWEAFNLYQKAAASRWDKRKKYPSLSTAAAALESVSCPSIQTWFLSWALILPVLGVSLSLPNESSPAIYTHFHFQAISFLNNHFSNLISLFWMKLS